MKLPVFLLVLSICGLCAQTPPADDPVVVVIEGKEWRKSDVEKFARSMPPAQMRNFYTNKKAFLEQFALTMRLAKIAEEKGFHQRDPYKSRKLYNDSVFWATALLNEQGSMFPVTDDDKAKYFEEHKSEYARAKVKVIYIGFTPEGVPVKPGSETRTKAEAEKLAGDIARRARGGEDFLQLVKTYSEDADSKAKDGDYPEIKPTDTAVPAAVKATVFGLKTGDVSEVVPQGNGFYVFRLENLVTPGLREVNDQVVLDIQKGRFDEWFASVRKGVSVEFKDEKYLSERGPGQ